MSPGIEIPGVRTKFRTDPERRMVIATLWVDGEMIGELGTISVQLLDGAGDSIYQAWVELIGHMVNTRVEEFLGIERGSLGLKRRKARD